MMTVSNKAEKKRIFNICARVKKRDRQAKRREEKVGAKMRNASLFLLLLLSLSLSFYLSPFLSLFCSGFSEKSCKKKKKK